MSKLFATAMLVMGALQCTNAAATQLASALAEEASVSDDKVTLLQSQVEVKKGESKALKQIAIDNDEQGEPSKYEDVSSCETSEKVVQPLEAKAEFPQSVSAQNGIKPAEADKASRLPLSTILQAMAVLLIMDVMRRCPWKAESRKSSKQTSKPASPKAAAESDSSSKFFTAVLAGDEAIFEAQVNKCRSQLSQIDTWGCSVMHYAAKGGSAIIVERLAALGAVVNTHDAWDETPLHLAARAGHIKACEALLVAGADADATNAEGCNALVVAGQADHEAVCRLLVEYGASAAGLPEQNIPEFVRGLLTEQATAAA